MDIEILFKNYGVGKRRLILIDKKTNMAFASFGEKDKEYLYISEKYPEVIIKECKLNAMDRYEKHCDFRCLKNEYCINFR